MIDRAETNRRGFTLVELLVSISIITLLAAMILVALSGVQENAKVDRTRAQIARIDSLISERWNSFEDRRVAISPSFVETLRRNSDQRMRGQASVMIAGTRLNLLREIMRMELPDRKSDVLDPPLYARQFDTRAVNGLQRAYQRKAAKLIAQKTSAASYPRDEVGLANWLDPRWSKSFDYAECLYLILSQMQDGEKPALSFFSEQELMDVDGDGIPEIRDGWGRPVLFLRWAPGYQIVGGPQERPHDAETLQPDPLNPFRIGGPTFPLYPLIASSGADGEFDMATDTQNTSVGLRYSALDPPNNPYVGWDINDPFDTADAIKMVGSYLDGNSDGRDDSLDNITNHSLIAGS